MYMNRVVNYLNYLKSYGLNIEDYNVYKDIRTVDVREYMKQTKENTYG